MNGRDSVLLTYLLTYILKSLNTSEANVLPAEFRAERNSKLSKLDVFCRSYSRNTFCNEACIEEASSSVTMKIRNSVLYADSYCTKIIVIQKWQPFHDNAVHRSTGGSGIIVVGTRPGREPTARKTRRWTHRGDAVSGRRCVLPNWGGDTSGNTQCAVDPLSRIFWFLISEWRNSVDSVSHSEVLNLKFFLHNRKISRYTRYARWLTMDVTKRSKKQVVIIFSNFMRQRSFAFWVVWPPESP